MPIEDIAKGCLELVVRAVVEAIFKDQIWDWFVYSGSGVIGLLTLGKVELSNKRPAVAGCIGAALHPAIVVLMIAVFRPHGNG